MRIDGPSREHLDRLGDQFTVQVEAAMRQAVTVAAKDVRGISPEFDLAPIRRVMATEIERTLLPELARQWQVAADDMRAKITRAALTADAVPGVPLNAEQQYLATARNRLVGVSDAVWEQAREQMVLGMQAGESIPQLRNRVTAATDLAAPRAAVIARTEVIGACNRGSYEQVKASGFQAEKTWLATGDTRTRPTHKNANGQTVPLEQDYKVGGIGMDGPHDPTAPPSETIQCRCTQTYDFGEGDFDLPATGRKAQAAVQGQPLTADDHTALKSYLDTPGLNRALRDDPRAHAGGELQRLWVQALSQAIAKQRLTETVRADRILSHPPDLRPGQVFRDDGFTSLSTVTLAGYIVHVTVPEGTAAASLPDTDELLLDHGTRFRVDHMTDDEMWVTVLP